MSEQVTVEINFLNTDLTVEGWYTPAVPGKTYGPPEDCYPEEPSDFEIDDILVNGISIYEMVECCQVVQNTQPISHRDFLLELAEACCEKLDETGPAEPDEPDEGPQSGYWDAD